MSNNRDLVWLVDDPSPESQDLQAVREVARYVARDRGDQQQGFRCLLETPEALLQEAGVERPRKRRVSSRRAAA